MKYFLVYRNEDLETKGIKTFNSKKEALSVMRTEEVSVYEVVLCSAESIKEMLKVFPEYRPKEYEGLINA